MKGTEIMLQHTEVKQRFTRIERDIEEAARSCSADKKLPQKFRECVMEWKQHAEKAKSIFESHDDNQMILCVDDLEKIGERAEAALEHIVNPDTKIKSSIMRANTELIDLMKQLH
jgi:hypothetical protein